MKSPLTGKPMSLRTEVQTLSFRKEAFSIRQQFYLCEDSGERFTGTKLDEINLSLVYNAYRAKHHIPTPDEIKETRENYGISALKMSEILGFGQNSYGLYERGEIPSLANAKLLKLAADLQSFRSLVEDWETGEKKQKEALLHKISRLMLEENQKVDLLETYLVKERQMSVMTGYRKPTLDKLKEMIIFFAHRVPSYKTKMNKLLFYADFSHFREFGVSISGHWYQAMPFGPVPGRFETIFEHLSENRMIEILFESGESGSKREKLCGRADRSWNSTAFSQDEFNSLDRIAVKFYHTTAGELVQISHLETAWLENEAGKNLISYEYALDLKAI
jgi:putative zinc finger/helix-turn-helix YgiT family protein